MSSGLWMIEMWVTRMALGADLAMRLEVEVAEAHRPQQLAGLLSRIEHRVAARARVVAAASPVEHPRADVGVGPPVDAGMSEPPQEAVVALAGPHAVEPVRETLAEQAGEAVLVAVADDRRPNEGQRVAGLGDAVGQVHVLGADEPLVEPAERPQDVAA